MHKFKKGDFVVAIKGCSYGAFKEGDRGLVTADHLHLRDLYFVAFENKEITPFVRLARGNGLKLVESPNDPL